MTRVFIPAPDIEADITAEPKLVESAVAAGRYVEVTTYRDGATEIRASLLFKTAADAANCARVLSKATVGSAVLADIEGPARGVASGMECERRRGWHDRFMCNGKLCVDFTEDDDTAPHGADEGSEDQ